MLLVIQNKYNGVYQVRLVGKGFSQTPGLDFKGYTECIKQCEENKTLKLEKAIYGLVQAARPFFKKIHNLLLQANFKAREADP